MKERWKSVLLHLNARAKSKRGSVLFVVLVIMAFMLIVTTAVYYTVMNNRQAVVMNYRDMQAYQTANDVLNTVDNYLLNISGDPNENDLAAFYETVFFEIGANVRCEKSCKKTPFPTGCVAGTGHVSPDCCLAPSGTCDSTALKGGATQCAAAIWNDSTVKTFNDYVATAGSAANGALYLKGEGTSNFGGGGEVKEMLVFVNEFDDIVVRITVEYESVRVSLQKMYDGSQRNAFAPSYMSPDGGAGEALGWEWRWYDGLQPADNINADGFKDVDATHTLWGRGFEGHFDKDDSDFDVQNFGLYPSEGRAMETGGSATNEKRYGLAAQKDPLVYLDGGWYLMTGPRFVSNSEAGLQPADANGVRILPANTGTITKAPFELAFMTINDALATNSGAVAWLSDELAPNGQLKGTDYIGRKWDSNKPWWDDESWIPDNQNVTPVPAHNRCTACGWIDNASITPYVENGVNYQWDGDGNWFRDWDPARATYSTSGDKITSIPQHDDDDDECDCLDCEEDEPLNTTVYRCYCRQPNEWDETTEIILPGVNTCANPNPDMASSPVATTNCGKPWLNTHSAVTVTGNTVIKTPAVMDDETGDELTPAVTHTPSHTFGANTGICSTWNTTNPCWKPTASTSEAKVSEDGHVTYTGPNNNTWTQGAATHISNQDGTKALYSRQAARGQIAPSFHNATWTLMGASNNRSFYIEADVTATDNMILGNAKFRNTSSSPLIVAVQGDLHIGGGVPAGAPTMGDMGGGEYTGNIIFLVGGDMIIHNTEGNLGSNGLFNTNVTFYILGDVTGTPPRTTNVNSVKSTNADLAWSDVVGGNTLSSTRTVANMLGARTGANGALPLWNFPADRYTGADTVTINWSNSAGTKVALNADAITNLARYGISVDKIPEGDSAGNNAERRRIHYIDKNTILNNPTGPGSVDLDKYCILLIDTGLDPNNVVYLRLDGTGTSFRWNPANNSEQVAILTLGNGSVVFEIPDAVTYTANGRCTIAPYNLAICPDYCGNCQSGRWNKCARTFGDNSFMTDGAVCCNANNKCSLTNTTGCRSTFIQSLLEPGTGSLRTSIAVNGRWGIAQRGHGARLNMNLFLVHNGTKPIVINQRSFFTGSIYTPKVGITTSDNAGGNLYHFGSLSASSLNIDVMGAFISALPGGGIGQPPGFYEGDSKTITEPGEWSPPPLGNVGETTGTPKPEFPDPGTIDEATPAEPPGSSHTMGKNEVGGWVQF
ncbi:MAG: pilus assembly PilX N-terminal domain-containing protein [Oscillospiraceae bacterium]|nr:pilus assembly PilX N-terminal domain-containing protein [Oscillospiraceae bacterium]